MNESPSEPLSDQSNEPDLRPFVAGKARVVGQLMAVLVLLACGYIGVFMPLSNSGDTHIGDRIGIVALGALMAWFCYRQASVSATPSPQGIVVRNLIFTRRLAWNKIDKVTMIDGDAWLRIQLADHDEVAVMAIQRADGEKSFAEARRMRFLFEHFSQ